MTKQQYFEFAARFFEACQTISKAKNADYTGGAADPFANFKAVEILGVSTEQGFLTRMMDKMKRIASFAEKGELQVKDESVTDTLRDLANYACLLAGYIESKKETVAPELPRYYSKGIGISLDVRTENGEPFTVFFDDIKIDIPLGRTLRMHKNGIWEFI